MEAFKSFTADLHTMADWLGSHRVKTVAMESTGVYWIPLSRSNEPQFAIRELLHVMLGADLAARTGKAKAVTATAGKLAVLFYNALRFA